MHVRIRLLDRFEVVVDGRPVPADGWGRQSATRLVKILALQPSRRLHREQLIDALWPDLSLQAGTSRLHSACHYARAALGGPDGVVLSGGSVTLLPGAEVAIDVAEFEEAVAAAREAGGAGPAHAAAARYAGPLLPDDLYEPWTEEPRARLRLRHREMLREAGLFEALVADDPLDEDAQIALARDLLRRGRRHDALQALDRMAEVLDRELGVAPSEAAVGLRQEALALPVGEGPPLPSRAPLPAARNRLIGRDRDLAELAVLLRRHRVVTITGSGGAGKSTLALAHARRVAAAGEERGEVIFAELAPVQEGDAVVRAVAEAAGVQGEAAVRGDALARMLGSRPALLVLDNCEHLLDAAAALVDAILDGGAETRVLVTSREPLGVDGEAVHALGSLGSGAAELFVERAAAATGADVAAVDDPRVAMICTRLDGLPLALELAAAQLRHLDLEELVRRLDDRLTLLSGGRPKAGTRHSALWDTIDWSHRLLSGDARELFARLSVFPASFDLDEVVAVSAGLDPPVVANLIGDLVAKSLVVHEHETGRYRLLESIRLYAAHHLAESGSGPEVTELLRRHVVERCSTSSRTGSWISASLAARNREDLDNVRLAFDACIARGDHTGAVDVALGTSMLWRNAVSYAEGRRWVGALLDRELADADRVWALLLAADVGLGSGDPRAMRLAATKAARLAARVDDPGATVLSGIYEALVHLDDPAQATSRLERAAGRAEEVGEPGLARLARGYRLVTGRMLGPSAELQREARDVDLWAGEPDYDRYICLWAASMIALVDRDASRLRRLMDGQLRDLAATGLRENWLTMYWEALALVLEGAPYQRELERALDRAEAEGRDADADGVLALACAAACGDDWERAAELVGAAAPTLLHDTAGFMHLTLVRDQMVRPQLSPERFDAAVARGAGADLSRVLAELGR